MTGCLYECLQEAHLERYHAHFVRHSITKCEGLAALSMQDYSKFGITRMEDRVRLFKLVQIVKSVQSEGRFCKHEDAAVIETTSRPVPQYIPHEQTKTRGQAFVHYLKSKSTTRLAGAGLASEPGWHMLTNYEPKPVAKPDSVMAPVKKRRPAEDLVKFRPGTGSPIFKCRKVLTFSDSDSDEEDDAHTPDTGSITDSEIRYKVLSTMPGNLLKKPPQIQPSTTTADAPVSVGLQSLQCHVPIKVTVEPPKSFFIEMSKNTSQKPAQNISVKPVVRETLFGCTSNTIREPCMQQGSCTKVANVFQSPPQVSKQKRISKHCEVEDGNVSTELLAQKSSLQVRSRESVEKAKLDGESDVDPDEYFDLPRPTHSPEKVFIPKVQSSHEVHPEIKSTKSCHSNTVQTFSAQETIKATHMQHPEPLKAIPHGQQTQSIAFSAGQVAANSVEEKAKVPADPILYNPAKYSPPQQKPQSTSSGTSAAMLMPAPEADQHLIRSATAIALPITIGMRSTESTKLSAPKSALLREARQRTRCGEGVDHAYFPTSTPAPSLTKEPVVERVVHSAEYNYGAPTVNRMAETSPAKQKLPNRSHLQRIRVCVRKRALTRREQKRQEVDVVSADGEDTIVVDETKVAIDLAKYIQQVASAIFYSRRTNCPYEGKLPRWNMDHPSTVPRHVYVFDEVFDETKTNKDVYTSTAKPLVKHIFNKGCATCFAFGQTGAGKTYTLLGTPSMPGLYRLAAADMFGFLHSGHYGSNLHLWVSYYEIYCSQLYDLLNKRKKLYVRENGQQRVCIAGLMETRVRNVDDVAQVVQYGNSVRRTGSTGVNPNSSRSHAILQLEIRDSRDQRLGRMSFIDLAGSERASDVTEFDRQTRIEGAEINQSLLAALRVQADPQTQLKECIRALDQDSRHTPYRQSKLTHILRDSFVGNSRTCMIANISPSLSACENTLNTLRYADRVKELRKTTPPNSAPPSVPTEPLTSHPSYNGALFHPSNIQFSSTPKQQEQERGPRDLTLTLQQDPCETPIRGHQIRKTPEKSKATPLQKATRSPVSLVKTSPFGFKIERNGGVVSIKTSMEVKARGKNVNGGSYGHTVSAKNTSPQQDAGSKPTSVNRSPLKFSSFSSTEKQHRNSSSQKSPCKKENTYSSPEPSELHQQHSSEKAYYRRQKASFGASHNCKDDEYYLPLKIPTAIDKLSMIGNDEKPNTIHGATISQCPELSSSLQTRDCFIKEHRQILNHLDNIMDQAKAAIIESSSCESSPQKPSPPHASLNEKSTLHSLQNSTSAGRLLVSSADEYHRYDEMVAQQSALYDFRSSSGIRPTQPEKDPIKQTFHALKEDTDTTEDTMEDNDNDDEEDSHMPDGHHFSPHRDDESNNSEDQLHSPLGSMCLDETNESEEDVANTSRSQTSSDGNEYCSCSATNHPQLAHINGLLPALSSKSVAEQMSVDKHNSGSSERSIASHMEGLELNHSTTLQQQSRPEARPESLGSNHGSAAESPFMVLHHSNHDITKHIDTIRQLLYEETPPSASSGALLTPLIPLPSVRSVPKVSFSGSGTGQIEQDQQLGLVKENASSQQGVIKEDSPLSHRLRHVPSSEFLQSLADIKICDGSTPVQLELDDRQARLSRVNPALARIGQTFKSPEKRVFPDLGSLSNSRKSSSFQPYHLTKSGAREICTNSATGIKDYNNVANASKNLTLDVSIKQELTSDSGISTHVDTKLSSALETPKDCGDDDDPEPVSSASTMDGVVSLSVHLEEESREVVQELRLQLGKVVHQQSCKQILQKEGYSKTEPKRRLLKHHSVEEMLLSEIKDECAMNHHLPVSRSLSDMGRDSLEHVQQTFTPIHPEPTNPTHSHLKTPAGVIPATVTPVTQAYRSEALEDQLPSTAVIVEELNFSIKNAVPPITIPEDENTPCSNASSGTSSARNNSSAVQQSQNLVLTAHEDQLSEITTLCKQEMHLLVAVRSGEKTFEEYIQATEDLLCSKAAAICTLRAQVSEFLRHPVLHSAGNTPR